MQPSTYERKDFKDFVLHDTWFDWSDESLTPDSISKKLMGSVSYWKRPEFGEVTDDSGAVVREAMAPHEIEKEILFEAGRDNWGLVSPYGKPYYQHMLTLMALLDAKTDITPTIADATQIFCESLTNGLKVLNLIGSQNAGKSAGSVRIAFACLYIDPEYCQIFVANPFDNVADSTIWGEVLEVWRNICETHPLETDDSKTYLFPKGYVYKNQTIIAIPNEPKGARIELRNVKKAGKFKGSKTRGKETDRGIILVLVDEINEIDSHAFLTVLPNLSSQEGFFCITSQNFKDEEDLGGQITAPVARYDYSKASFDELDIDDDQWWASAYSSTTLRFDGKRSANMQAKRTIYGYLFKKSDWDRLAELGVESSDFASQARSFPQRSAEKNSVLPRSVITGSRHDDVYYSMLDGRTLVSFCDPAFGGKDKAKWGYAVFGRGFIKDAVGNQVESLIFEIPDYFVTLKFVRDAVYNDYWLARMINAGIRVNDVVVGSEVSPEDQVAIQCAEHNYKYKIPSSSFGYDFSMKPGVVTSMNKYVGLDSHAFDYNSKPHGTFIEQFKKDSEEVCVNRVTELAFLTSDLFHTKVLRGGQKISTAITQLSRTRYEDVRGKRKCDDKKTYKGRWQGASPDDRDVLMGLRGMADIHGMTKTKIKSNSVSSPDISEAVRRKFSQPTAKRLA